jgi:non-heme chloroperoxidase
MHIKRILVLTSLAFFLSIAFVISGQAKDKEQWKDQYVAVGDIKIHYLDAGSGDRTLVFIPGWTLSAEIWKNQILYFSSRGFRVIALDPRSQGLTTKTDIGNTYQQHAADLQVFLNNLKIDHFCLIGWNASVTTLLEYISSSETFTPENMVFVGGSPAELKTDDYPGPTSILQARSLFLGLQDKRDKAAAKYVRSLFKENPSGALLSELTESSLKTPMSAAVSLLFDRFTGDRKPALLHISTPTLIIANSDNRAMGEYFKSKIQRATLQIIEGTGEAMFLEKPQAFNQAIESFLGER